ncbi:MAG: serine/threonine-protein kinase [Isosphaeraceae bacterium]
MAVDPGRCVHCGGEMPADAAEGRCPHCGAQPPLDDTGLADSFGATTEDSGITVAPVARAGAPWVPRVTPDESTCDPDQTQAVRTPSGELPRGATVRYFGDYELQKELGRGGMGVVYRALQVSLNRTVALKMIRSGVFADNAELQRFQNEAQAVALLDHAGIVPVYEVGEHDGQRYFSMKLVEGGNLADRLPSFSADPRAAATLLAETAEAVHHAHMRGVLHRDLKPANILVDAQGHPHVTDFGLAKRVEDDVELTASGAILGTPAYMSPEQTEGRRGTITTATDVYGLGAILYTLLAGKAPFGGGLADTLHAVREKPPEPPRGLNANVPRDLETICLKCLAKDPRRRYPSAQALADDLRCWLDARPIAARRVGLAERAWLWCRRKPAVAALAAAVAVAVLAGTVGIFAVQARANAELRLSNQRLGRQRSRAEEREQQAITAVKRFRDAVAENPELKGNRSLEALRKTLLKQPLAYFRSLRTSLQAEGDTDPGSLDRLAQAGFELGALNREIGEARDALDAHREALAIRVKLAEAHPSKVEYLSDLADSQSEVGQLLNATGQPDDARRALEAALALRQTLVDRQPRDVEYQSKLAVSHVSLGNLLRDLGRTVEARQAYEHALEIQRRVVADNPAQAHQHELAQSLNNYGMLLRSSGQAEAAKGAYESSRAILEKLTQTDASVPLYLKDLALSHNNLGIVLRAEGKLDESRKAYEAARDIQRKLADAHPSVTEYQTSLATTLNNLGNLGREAGQPDAARASFEASRGIFQKLAESDPSELLFQSALAGCHDAIGNLFREAKQPDAARKSFEAAVPILERLARENPASPEYSWRMGGLLNNMALNDLATKEFPKARDRLLQAIVWQKKALAVNPRNPTYRQSLSNHLTILSNVAMAMGLEVEAGAVARELAELVATDPRFEALDARLARVIGGETPASNTERLSLAQRAYDTQRFAAAARLLAEALEGDPRLAEDHEAGHRYNAACAAALASTGGGKDGANLDSAAREKLRRQARDWLTAELGVQTRILETGSLEEKASVAPTLKHWQEDSDLSGVRDARALEALEEAERVAWVEFWSKVEQLQTQGRGVAGTPAGTK